MGKQRDLRRLLEIKDLEEETIFGVIGRMEILKVMFESDKKYRNFLPFLEVYYLVTKHVAERAVERRNYFNNYAKVERLDVNFANLYFKPMLAYLLLGEKPTPWKTYFDYCERPNGIPFVQMILGINAHINSDLARAIYLTRFKDEHDDKIIDNLLRDVIPDILYFLAVNYRDIFSIGGIFMSSFIEHEFEDTICKWRSVAWDNIQGANILNIRSIMKELNFDTEAMGQELISIFENIMHFDHISTELSHLNKLKVTLDVT